MSSSGFSPKSPNRYLAPNVYLSSVVARNRQPTGADYRQPETGKLYPIASYWMVSIDPTTGVQGELWYLSKIVANVAYWLMVSAGASGPLLNITVPSGVSPIVPDGAGTVHFTSSLGTLTITGSSASPNNHTINFDLSGGSVGIDSIAVQAITAPGVTPVLPTVAGLMTVSGAVVANHSVVIETRSRALNSYNVEVQYATSAAATDGTKSGVAHFNSSQFSVDASGFVALAGGGQAIDSVGVDATSGGGTNPVLPTVAGLITVNGALVAAGTNPIRTVSTAANVYQIQVQTSQALVTTDATKVGLANFNSAQFTVDANGFVSSISSVNPQGVSNLGISYSASTFSVTSANGTALSASNIGYVVLPSKAIPGTLVTVAVTANQTFIDDSGASTIAGNLLGFGAADLAATDVPIFLYAVLSDSETAISFMISRTAGMTLSPVAADIGKTGSSIADNGWSFFALSNPTVADYESNPCVMIGSFRMRLTTAPGDWTVQALSGRDGIGSFQEDVMFTWPTAVMGASTNSHWIANGGTAPAWTDSSRYEYLYYMEKNGIVNAYYSISGDPSTDGAGAVAAGLTQPLKITPSKIKASGFGRAFFAGVNLLNANSLNTNDYSFVDFSNTTSTAQLFNSDLTAAALVDFELQLSYVPRRS